MAGIDYSSDLKQVQYTLSSDLHPSPSSEKPFGGKDSSAETSEQHGNDWQQARACKNIGQAENGRKVCIR
jgi:hypothetical protein